MMSHLRYIPLLMRAGVMGFAAVETLALVMEDKFKKKKKTLSAQADTDQDHLDNFPSCR